VVIEVKLGPPSGFKKSCQLRDQRNPF